MSAPALAVAAANTSAAVNGGMIAFGLLFVVSFAVSVAVASKKGYKKPVKFAFVAAVVTTAIAGAGVYGVAQFS